MHNTTGVFVCTYARLAHEVTVRFHFGDICNSEI